MRVRFRVGFEAINTGLQGFECGRQGCDFGLQLRESGRSCTGICLLRRIGREVGRISE